jgi:hypothetical protein
MAEPAADPHPAHPRAGGLAGVVPEQFLRWARAVARGVRRDFGFPRGQAEEQDLEAVAYLTLVEFARGFDPARCPAGVGLVDYFKGSAYEFVKYACWHEAERLRNAGTYHRRRPGRPAVVVEYLSQKLTAAGEPFELPDPRTVEGET